MPVKSWVSNITTKTCRISSTIWTFQPKTSIWPLKTSRLGSSSWLLKPMRPPQIQLFLFSQQLISAKRHLWWVRGRMLVKWRPKYSKTKRLYLIRRCSLGLSLLPASTYWNWDRGITRRWERVWISQRSMNPVISLPKKVFHINLFRDWNLVNTNWEKITKRPTKKTIIFRSLLSKRHRLKVAPMVIQLCSRATITISSNNYRTQALRATSRATWEPSSPRSSHWDRVLTSTRSPRPTFKMTIRIMRLST